MVGFYYRWFLNTPLEIKMSIKSHLAYAYLYIVVVGSECWILVVIVNNSLDTCYKISIRC